MDIENINNLFKFLFAVFVAFWGIERCYLSIARHFGIGVSVGERSSHVKFTPTGGGIVLVAAILLFSILIVPNPMSLLLGRAMTQMQSVQYDTWHFMPAIGASLVLAVISFVDDIWPLPALPRLFVQIAAVSVAFSNLIQPHTLNVFFVVLLIGVGCINAFNFIDGICGMMSFYGIVTTAASAVAWGTSGLPCATEYVLLCVLILIALVAFACFNLGDKMFFGDVGAITLGFLSVLIIGNLILQTGQIYWLALVAVIVADTGLTTFKRLFQGKNILKAHRECLYQQMVNIRRWPHLAVASSYAAVQMMINAGLFMLPEYLRSLFAMLAASALIVIYFLLVRTYKPRAHATDGDGH